MDLGPLIERERGYFCFRRKEGIKSINSSTVLSAHSEVLVFKCLYFSSLLQHKKNTVLLLDDIYLTAVDTDYCAHSTFLSFVLKVFKYFGVQVKFKDLPYLGMHSTDFIQPIPVIYNDLLLI